jgi:hypothetical protein
LLKGGLYLAPTTSCELFANGAKIFGCFAPRLHLSLSLAFENRLLLLDFLAGAFDILLDVGLERVPFRLESCFLFNPFGLVGIRLLFQRITEVIALFAHVSESLVGFGAGASLELANLGLK